MPISRKPIYNGQIPGKTQIIKTDSRRNRKLWLDWLKSKEIKLLILKLPTKNALSPDGFYGKFYQTCKEELVSILHQLLQTIEEGEHFPNHFMRPELPWSKTHTRVSQGKKPTDQNYIDTTS